MYLSVRTKSTGPLRGSEADYRKDRKKAQETAMGGQCTLHRLIFLSSVDSPLNHNPLKLYNLHLNCLENEAMVCRKFQ